VTCEIFDCLRIDAECSPGHPVGRIVGVPSLLPRDLTEFLKSTGWPLCGQTKEKHSQILADFSAAISNNPRF
jgi:hypothetical protein